MKKTDTPIPVLGEVQREVEASTAHLKRTLAAYERAAAALEEAQQRHDLALTQLAATVDAVKKNARVAP